MTKMDIESVTINGAKYIREDLVCRRLDGVTCDTVEGLPYVLTRPGQGSSVFFGFMKSRKGQEVELVQARRVWSWSGAKTLSELALYGPQKPKECKFGEPISVILTDAVEIIFCTEISYNKVLEVPKWE